MQLTGIAARSKQKEPFITEGCLKSFHKVFWIFYFVCPSKIFAYEERNNFEMLQLGSELFAAPLITAVKACVIRLGQLQTSFTKQ